MKNNFIESGEMDRLFKEATLEAADMLGQQYLKEAEKDPYLPSFEYNQRIKKLIETETSHSTSLPFFQKLYFVYSKAAAWILLALVIMFLAVPKVSAARDWVKKLIIEANPQYVTYYLQEKETAVEGSYITEDVLPIGTYYPSYLPEGLKLRQLIYDGSTTTYRFISSQGKFVIIQVIGSDTTMNLDNENLEAESQEVVNGIEAKYTLKSERHNVIWKVEEYLLIVNTNMSKEETLRIATGLVKVK